MWIVKIQTYLVETDVLESVCKDGSSVKPGEMVESRMIFTRIGYFKEMKRIVARVLHVVT